MQTILIRNGRLVNRGNIEEADVFIKNGRIAKIAASISENADIELDAAGNYVIPGIIDTQTTAYPLRVEPVGASDYHSRPYRCFD